ncbi:MAG: type II toxin-antitoxin system death-on-curing family toxin [Dehalococcoidia bacterium]
MARLWYPKRSDLEELAYALAAELFDDYDSSLPSFALLGGERSGGAKLLESALALPRQTFGGRLLYPRIHHKAGVLLRSLIKNHALVDGNKRMAMATTTLFLFMNGHLLLPSSQEMVRFAVEVASSEPGMDWREVAEWVRDNTIPMTGDKRQAIRLVREKFSEPEEIIERLMDRWQDIARFISS